MSDTPRTDAIDQINHEEEVRGMGERVLAAIAALERDLQASESYAIQSKAALEAAERAIDDCHSYRSHTHFEELALIRAALTKNQCGGSRSLTEAPLSSTAQSLPASRKEEKPSDAGPSACEPALQREPRTTDAENAVRDRSDTERIDWLASEVRCYGDGYTEPREASVVIDWQQTKEEGNFPGLRVLIDRLMTPVTFNRKEEA